MGLVPLERRVVVITVVGGVRSEVRVRATVISEGGLWVITVVGGVRSEVRVRATVISDAAVTAQ